MKARRIMVLGLAVMCTMTWAGEVMARGGNGNGSRNGTGVQTHVPAQTPTTRPADSQRRDGTFLTTGTTAGGFSTRPANDQGLQDGSGLPSATAVPVIPTTVSE